MKQDMNTAVSMVMVTMAVILASTAEVTVLARTIQPSEAE